MVTQTNNTIEFSFSLDDLFEQISIQSLYAAKSAAVSDQRVDPADVIGITVDERDFVDNALRKALSDLFVLFVWQSEAIENSVFDNEDGRCGFSINRQSGYNTNRLHVVDVNCAEFLKNFVLGEWAKTMKLDVDMQVYIAALGENAKLISAENVEIGKRPYALSYTVTKEQIEENGSFL